MTLIQELEKKAQEHGFPLSGGVDFANVLEASFKTHVQRYDEWLGNHYEGDMQYLRRGRDRRADPRLVLPEAKSVFCVGLPYWRQPIGENREPRYARYVKGPDYHENIAERLEVLMGEIKSSDSSLSNLRWKVCVDTSAVLERSWAALAGLGWIGKNTALIHPKYGSYFFLGEVLLNVELGREPNPLPNYCGNCSRCLDSCPTGAFETAGKLDSRRCISYWTLEKRGELALDSADRRKMGTWVAGCDICQEVCPFNTKPSREHVKIENSEREATELLDWSELLDESPESYSKRIEDSALDRIKPPQFSRNLAIAFGNYLSSLEDPGIWKNAVISRIERETDPIAREEWSRNLAFFNSSSRTSGHTD